jgi:DNA-binding SARP family transcriptional activator
MSLLQCYFFGPAQFRRDDRPVELSNNKAVALLAYLAVTGKSQGREYLTALLWPNSPAEAARKNLRNTLWQIRKALGDEVVQSPNDRLGLGDEVWTDVHAFETAARALIDAPGPAVTELQAAIELYQGLLLEDLTLLEAPDFEVWLTTERERFGQLYLRLLERLTGVYRAGGNWQEMIAVAQQALAHDNLQEPMYRTLMEAHARLDERAEALRQYDLLRTVLAQELGVEPLPETETLRQAIVDGNLQPATRPAAVVPLPAPRRPAGPAQTRQRPFVGRQTECVALDEALDLATNGQMKAIFLTGELGIGKSRLWQAWSARLPASYTVLETRCLDTTQALPFAPLTGLFRERPCVEHLLKPPSPLSPVWLAELARLLPEISEYWPELPPPAILSPEEERRRLFEALTQTLQTLESRPLILFIDDLHWADRSTLDWLVYLIDRMQNEPLLFIGAYRPDEAATQLVHLVTGWTRAGLARRLPLARLTLEEAVALVEAHQGQVELAEQLQAQSAGNPYFLIELSQAAPNGTPPKLAELVRERLKRLPETARQVLQAAAILEARIEFAILRRTSGRGEEEMLDALDVLLEASVLNERDGHYEFVHPLVATIVRSDLSVARRSFLHRRAAEALEASYAGHLAVIAGELTSHYTQAGRPAQAAHYAELAAQHALELTAPAEAVAFYRQAVFLEPTPSRQVGLGQALSVQGKLEEARQVFHQALAAFEAQQDAVNAARVSLMIAENFVPYRQGDQVVEWANRAQSLVAAPDPDMEARIYFLSGTGKLQIGQSLAEAEAELRRSAELAGANDLPGMAAQSWFELGNLQAERGDLNQALKAYQQSITLAREANRQPQEILGYNNLAYHTMLAGDLNTARQHIETALALAKRYSIFLPRLYLYSTRGEIALAEGQFDTAKTWLKRAIEEAEKQHNQVQRTSLQAHLGLVARERGDLDQALVLLEEARHGLTHLTATFLQSKIELWLAELHLQRGEQAAAREVLTEVEARLAHSDHHGLQAWAARVRALT